MDGVLIIDKPAGITSHDVVARVRKLVRERRVGHTGTLDPFATGVLVIMIGRATRLAQFLSGTEKEYEGIIRLGYATDSGDLTGERIEENAKPVASQMFTAAQIESALASLRGEIDQIPPMFSAKKIGGRKLYELAREGEQMERAPVRVTVSRFELRADTSPCKDNRDGTCDLKVRVAGSAGTYVRTLAEDFGRRLGVGAHLAELRRTRAGEFKIADAMTLERLSEMAQTGEIARRLVSLDDALSHLPAIDLSPEDAKRTQHGIDLRIDPATSSNWEDGKFVRMRDATKALVAVGRYDRAQQAIHPGSVISIGDAG